jgi:hypothetical protein
MALCSVSAATAHDSTVAILDQVFTSTLERDHETPR